MVNEARSKKRMQLVINGSWCKGCGICIDLCPHGALAKDVKEKAFLKFEEKCTRCGLCELRCPDLAISLVSSS